MKRLAAAVVLAVVTTLSLAVPATASDRPLQLSRDGETWSDTLSGTLFDPALRWVPGDRRVATFHVRNGAATPADLSLAGVGNDVDHLVADGMLLVSARVDAGEWTAIGRLGAEHPLGDVAVAASGSMRVDVAVELSADAPNATMLRTLPLDLRVRLTDGRVGPTSGSSGSAGDPNGSGGATTDGVLPATGAPEVRMTLLTAATLIGMGLALVAARRRRDEEGATRATA